MELFSYFRSSAAYRVRIGLNIKGIPHTLTDVNLLEGDHRRAPYLALNPQGLVPALKLDDGRVINQSPAMLEYLEAVYPDGPLLPEDPYDAAVVRNWCSLIACDIHPVNNLRILKFLTGTLSVSEDEKLNWYRHWIKLGFEALEPQLSANPYCFGSNITFADLYLIPQVYNALRFHQDMTDFPKIQQIYETCNQLDAFIKASPDHK